ncbi:hypothetical protein [Serratia marcescens]|uniref:hypothetical protein n=1 Tax=Serratia marcescens TaxID=615 RepID=UPI0027E58421|nr:hypothetical protein [Serratia marcescens]WLS20123.1 hypothetical protein RAA91_02725 [Serratia marcescens]HCB1443226.1 hypothetical protein [Serratia marcescens]HCB1482081.1 hypothetical protein [Serratia marcescens]HCB1610755.1 hypothetical protein [Serratia marcescens]HCB1617379.1 hypothetical protein [Serratia marcescens]
MKGNIFSHVYITNHTFSTITIKSNYDDIEKFTRNLASILDEYKKSHNVKVECAKDILEYSSSEDIPSLEECILHASNGDDSFYQLYCDMIEKAISKYKSNLYSSLMENNISNKNKNAPPVYYPLSINNATWPGIDKNTHTSGWMDTLNRNSKFIAYSHKNKNQFITWSKINYEYIHLHDNLTNTLDSILDGTYLDYKEIITDSLNTLNQSYHILSNDPQKNLDDLNTISHYTSLIGRQLACSRQGSNKLKFKFPVDQKKGIFEEINCEYHLKINNMDNGKKLKNTNYVRIYFGLKSYSDRERKEIKIAHIGKHL